MATFRHQPPAAVARAAVVYANYYQFGSGQRLSNGPVQSRMLLWCEAGGGRCVINGETCAMTPNQFVLLPWMHRIQYLANVDEPFLLGGVHVVPDYRPARSFTLGVAHREESPLFNVPGRRDAEWPALGGVVSGSLLARTGLGLLARYCVQRFLDGRPGGWECYHLGQLLVRELEQSVSAAPSSRPMPLQVQQIMQYVINHPQEEIAIADLTRLSGWSESTLQRRFQQHLGCSPAEWIQRHRFQRACQLLRTTRTPIGEVAQRVGIGDPYYFSRWFRQRSGQTASAYRRQVRPW